MSLCIPVFAGVESESKETAEAKPSEKKEPVIALGSSKDIDAILARSWKEAGVKPNPPVSDEVFLRRVYLDVIGRIPSHAEATSFLQSGNPKKRAKLIDELLASEGS